MDEIAESYSLQTVEQLRGVADPLRIRIFEALAQRPMTATQVGEELNIAAPKAHYHVRELERIGLVRLVETRERGGILEKYYRAIARNLNAPPQLLQTAEPGEMVAALTQMFTGISQSFLRALERISREGAESFERSMMALNGETVWMTPGEFRAMMKEVEALLEPYRQRRGAPGEREAQVMMIAFDSALASLEERDMASASTADALPLSQPRRRRVVLVGMLTYRRDELEQVIALGDQLDLDVVGYLAFSDDVTPDLVDRAIAHLRCRGVLSARTEVREALKRKEAHGATP